MQRNGLILEDKVVDEDQYIQTDVRLSTIMLLEDLKEEFHGKVSLMLVLGYKPDDMRYVSALKQDYIGEAVESVDKCVPPIDSFASNIHYLTELAGGRIYVNSLEAIPAVSLLTHHDDDGAYLLDEEGGLLHNARKLRPDPEDVLEEMGVENHRMLWERFRFVTPVGTKHTSGIAASYKMPHTEIYVVSEESGKIRGFHKGRIILSPHQEEITM